MKSIPVVLLFWYIFPIIILFACKFIVQRLSLEEKYKIKSPDLAIPFLIVGLHIISKESFLVSIAPYVIIIMLLIGIGVAIGHAKYYGDIQYARYFKMFWRISFLLVLFVYILLVIVSIIHFV